MPPTPAASLAPSPYLVRVRMRVRMRVRVRVRMRVRVRVRVRVLVRVGVRARVRVRVKVSGVHGDEVGPAHGRGTAQLGQHARGLGQRQAHLVEVRGVVRGVVRSVVRGVVMGCGEGSRGWG